MGAGRLHDVDVGLRGVLERKLGTDDRAEGAVVESGVDRGMNVGRLGFGDGPEGEGADRRRGGSLVRAG